jgi:formylglycine-generating enzyme required for sulfatase activity
MKIILLVTVLSALSPSFSRNIVAQPTATPSPASGFGATVANSSPAPQPSPEGMVWIPGGEFTMGAATNGSGSCEMPMASNDTEPAHRVRVDGFWMDTTTVTNEQFEKFVRATGYVTIAERTPTNFQPRRPKIWLQARSCLRRPTMKCRSTITFSGGPT